MYEHLKVWMNGKLVPWRDATVPLLSHGFSRGSAIFEVFGTHRSPRGTVAFRMDEHLKRLMKSADLLGMQIGYSGQHIVDAVAETIRANKLGRGLVKILAYWGEEAIIQLVLESKLDVSIFAIPSSEELGLDNATPISACISNWRKLHPETVPVEAKACANYLNSYLARRDASLRGFDVGLLLGTDGFLSEGSIESVFLVKNGVLITPPLGRILSSITRMSILQAAQSIGIPSLEKAVRIEDVFSADEIFVCHTGIKILPIARFENRSLEAPGPVTHKLMKLMERIFSFSEDKFKDWFTLCTESIS
ncbi:MAG: aminotransferase class IV [Deltaproteobacteria bacterium]|nr:aminotransferase class IV [Deltaproteobacteria bacterium]